jgi:hypothetical protein
MKSNLGGFRLWVDERTQYIKEMRFPSRSSPQAESIDREYSMIFFYLGK